MDNFIVFLSFINTLLTEGGARITKETGFAPGRLQFFTKYPNAGVRGKDSNPAHRVFSIWNPEYIWTDRFEGINTTRKVVDDDGPIDLRHPRFCDCETCSPPSLDMNEVEWDL